MARNRIKTGLGAVAVLAVVIAVGVYIYWGQLVPVVGQGVNYAETLHAAPGMTSTELASGGSPVVAIPLASTATATSATAGNADWPSYNKTLTSERFSNLTQINTGNAARMKVLCTYDTKQRTSFETGPLVVNGMLIATTEFDIFALDPTNCQEKWRTHEDYKPASLLAVNRGAAYLDGMLFRGTEDGRVLAYDFGTGKRLWSTTVADAAIGESTSAAPIAWNGLVFIGNAGGDAKGIKGRMYALDAKTGRIVWEFFLVPKGPEDHERGPQGKSPLDRLTWHNTSGTTISGGATWTSYTLDPATGRLYVPGGNSAPSFVPAMRKGENLYSGTVIVLDAKTGDYINHLSTMPRDWHDWDVSNTPALIRTRAGRRVLTVAPKDGHLYGFDLATSERIYRTPVTTIENADVPFSNEKAVHFCPGTNGGAEWNGAAYDPTTNLIVIGETDWCFAVKTETEKQLDKVKTGGMYAGEATLNPYNVFGKADPYGHWAGWLYAVDADTGAWRWRLKSNYPIMGGVTPTAGGVIFFGDMGGNVYAVNAANGERLWGQRVEGAIGGGVITYAVGGVQRVAVAAGFTSITWPTEVTMGKILILGLSKE